ncbi:hypothetical protein AB0N05_27885 [Nocardia sp. NPDC051030]|uniref:hypothetical protein n=1 Tax=Nocardia sp. NPDC051030 TaxID=3155162 RepID=UPI00343C83B1
MIDSADGGTASHGPGRGLPRVHSMVSILATGDTANPSVPHRGPTSAANQARAGIGPVAEPGPGR